MENKNGYIEVLSDTLTKAKKLVKLEDVKLNPSDKSSLTLKEDLEAKNKQIEDLEKRVVKLEATTNKLVSTCVELAQAISDINKTTALNVVDINTLKSKN